MAYQWAVIGAGPAGIAAVGQLIDHGVPAQEIVWIDPKFSVGDFGTTWRNVISNTKVELFLKFLHICKAFDYQQSTQSFALNEAQKNKTCLLHLMADALQWVSLQLKNKVTCVEDFAEKLSLNKRLWHIKLKQSDLQASNVILAIGAEPKNLSYLHPAIIPLQDALNPEKLNAQITADDTVAVFGSSHSAVLALRNLMACSVKQVINFYQFPLMYAVYLEDWILFDDTGLKGPTAEWARENLDGQLPDNLKRVFASTENIEQHLALCDKAIYAVGFERRPLPVIEGFPQINYMEQSGIIAPGLFGLGIAFPEGKYNPLGMLEYRVGLWKFMDYLLRVLPIWLRYPA